jgi:single-strand DNA-binding protein
MPDSSVTIVGNITRDPEIRYTAGGAAKASFGVAVSRRWQNRQSQEWEEQTSFFNVVCWREMAENVSESLAKGSRVVVTGRLEQRSWETENGEKRSVVEVVADEIGPSLRWATAAITRNERKGGGDFGGGGSGGNSGGGNSGGGNSGGGNSGGGGGGASPRPAPDNFDDGGFSEEPF